MICLSVLLANLVCQSFLCMAMYMILFYFLCILLDKIQIVLCEPTNKALAS